MWILVFEPLAEIVASEELDFVQFAYAISTRDAEARMLLDLMEKAVADGRPKLHTLPYAAGRQAVDKATTRRRQRATRGW